jgi:large subunit ribosomal protein L17
MGKRGDGNAYSRASSFVLKRSVLPKLFGTYAERYAERPGGYTRIHKFGRRQGDNAPHAILELVDNPKDLRYEITARTVGWELLRENLKTEQPISLINNGIDGAEELIEQEKLLQRGAEGKLREKTRWNLQKVLRYRDPSTSLDFARKAGDYIVSLRFLLILAYAERTL